MTNSEFEKFKTHLYVCFPSVKEWLDKNSPNPEATESVWRKTLSDCSMAECAIVVDNWISGKVKGFEAYERDKIALMIRQTVLATRDRENAFNGASRKRFEQSEEERAEYRKTKRGDYRPIDADQPGLAQKFAQGRELQKRFKDGEIDESEFYRLKRELIDSVA